MTDEDDRRFRVTTTEQLQALTVAGEKHNYNRQLVWTEVEKQIDPKGVHLLERIMLHNDDHWRCWLLIKEVGKEEPTRTIIDVSLKDWERLLTVTQFMSLVHALED